MTLRISDDWKLLYSDLRLAILENRKLKLLNHDGLRTKWILHAPFLNNLVPYFVYSLFQIFVT